MKSKKLITAIVAIVLLTGVSFTADASQRGYRVNEREVRGLLSRIETGADRFQKSLDSALDRSRLDGSRQEDNINQFVKDFENATDRLKDQVNNNKSAASDAEEVLRQAAVIDGFMRRQRLASRAENDWSSLRRDLDTLARLYRISWRWTNSDARRDRRDGWSYRDDDRSNRSGRRAYYVSEGQLRSLISRIETGADRFRKSLDAALDRSRLDGSRQEDNINEFVKDFEAATNRLKDHFNDDRSAASDAEEVLRRAAVIDGFMRRQRLASRAENDWSSLRRDLDTLAQAYRVSWRWDSINRRNSRN